MELIAAPPPTPPTLYRFSDDNFDLKNITTTSPSPHLQLQLPLRSPKHNPSLLHNFPYHPPSPIPPQPLITPQTTPPKNNHKTKTKVATTLDILHLLDALSFPIPLDTYTSLIKECTFSRDPETAIELLNHITHSGIKPTLPLLNRILIMFISCGLLDNARHLFDKMTVRDFNSWATLFVAYFDNADYEEATSVFISMIEDLGMSEFPNWIWDCLLKACACSTNFALGLQVHGWLLKLGTCDGVVISTSLINFYGQFRGIKDANLVFNRLSRHNTMTWTAKIVSGCKEKQFFEVVSDFKEMGREGIKKDTFTFSSVLKACGKMLDHGRCGKQVHADAIKLGLVEDHYVHCSLIAMYGRGGLLRDAKRVFEMKQNERDDDCWNAMFMGYIYNGLNIEALKFLYQMKEAGIRPQESLRTKLRIACGSVTY
ncbi:hypothetical protein RIF29_36671 [Crotalaria pallida]|uniref:Pentatricopeptide repeat protein n=1 Tax=Crotalaria pallida TaxID=3830 RepID=A0AAN9ECH2_CROPI